MKNVWKTAGGIWKRLSVPRSPKSSETRKLALAISGRPEIHTALAEALPADWTIVEAGDLPHALDILSTREIPIVLLDRDTPVLEWRDAVMRLAAAPYRCCVILLSSVVNQNLWDEVAGCGGFEVLAKTVTPGRLSAVVKAGWSQWSSRRALFTR
jgi:DNA-binding response OmpR family regulator